MQPIKFISICSGVEAASLAWLPLGFEPVAYAEIDDFPSAVLAAKFPNTPNLGDCTKVDWSKYRGAVSLVAGAHLAKPSQLPESERGSSMTEVSSCSSLSELYERLGLSTWCGRMLSVPYPKTEGEPLVPSSGSWLNAGIHASTGSLTLSLPEYPCETITEELPDGSVRSHSVAGVSFLSQFLQDPKDVPQRYLLSDRACKGIIRRAARRGKSLPPKLQEALEHQAGMDA